MVLMFVWWGQTGCFLPRVYLYIYIMTLRATEYYALFQQHREGNIHLLVHGSRGVRSHTL